MTRFIDINFREHINLAYVERIVTRSDGQGGESLLRFVSRNFQQRKLRRWKTS